MANFTGTKLSGFEQAIASMDSVTGPKLAAQVDRELSKIANKAAEEMKAQMDKTRPLSPLTVAIRGALGFASTDRLVRSGLMKRSIQAKRLGLGRWFVGIPSGIRVPRSRLRLDKLARIHEGGDIITFKITESFLKFVKLLAIRGVFQGPGRGSDESGQSLKLGRTFSIVIPARPFIFPVARKLQDKLLGELVEGFTVNTVLAGVP